MTSALWVFFGLAPQTFAYRNFEGTKRTKMAVGKIFFNSPDHLIRCKEFNLEYDGGFHFSIDQKFWVNNLFVRLAIFGIFLKNFSPLFELQE